MGCMTVPPALTVIKLNAPPGALAARAPRDVTIFATGAPARPFVEVALIQSRKEWGTTEQAEGIFERMRVAAARMGCDGLVLLGEANVVDGMIYPVPGMWGAETHGTIDTREGFRGACIVWTEGKSAAPPPAVAPPASTGAGP